MPPHQKRKLGVRAFVKIVALKESAIFHEKAATDIVRNLFRSTTIACCLL